MHPACAAPPARASNAGWVVAAVVLAGMLFMFFAIWQFLDSNTRPGAASASAGNPIMVAEDKESSAAKRSVMESLLNSERAVNVTLDARRLDVKVPADVRDNPQLVLLYGRHTQPPIPDLKIDASGIRATLSFRGQPQPTFVPWRAVYAITSEDTGRGTMWQAHVPPGVNLVDAGADVPR
jgi:stringent starvation protein B